LNISSHIFVYKQALFLIIQNGTFGKRHRLQGSGLSMRGVMWNRFIIINIFW